MPSVTKSPTAAKNVMRSGIDSRSWTYVTRVFESESTPEGAILMLSMSSSYPYTDYLMCSGFGFEIPNEAMITGITCHINARGSTDSTGFSVVSLTTNYSNLAGNNLSDGSILPNSYTIKDFGGDSELWGVNLTPNIVNSTNFGVALAFEWVTRSASANVDHIQITVHYEEPIDQSVSPAGIASAETFGSPSLSFGAISVNPSGIQSAETFGSPSLSFGAISVNPSGIQSGESFGSPAINLGPIAISPNGIASEEFFGIPSVTQDDTVRIFPQGILSGESFGIPEINAGGIDISPAGIQSEESFGVPNLHGSPLTILARGIKSEESFGVPTILYVGHKGTGWSADKNIPGVTEWTDKSKHDYGIWEDVAKCGSAWTDKNIPGAGDWNDTAKPGTSWEK